MGLKYVDEDMAVFHGIFRGIRVRDLKSGRVLVPSIPIKAQVLSAWSAMPKVRFTSRLARQMAERAIFRDCGRITLDPKDARAMTLTLMTGVALLDYYRREGEMDAVSVQFDSE